MESVEQSGMGARAGRRKLNIASCRASPLISAAQNTALNIFNSRACSVQEFVPLDPSGKNVGMYCCGPTVYDFGHIGNFRSFVFTDSTSPPPAIGAGMIPGAR